MSRREVTELTTEDYRGEQGNAQIGEYINKIKLDKTWVYMAAFSLLCL